MFEEEDGRSHGDDDDDDDDEDSSSGSDDPARVAAAEVHSLIMKSCEGCLKEPGQEPLLGTSVSQCAVASLPHSFWPFTVTR